MIQDPGIWPGFSTKLKELMKVKDIFTEFSLNYVPRSQNVTSDSLAKITRAFYRNLYYIDYCIMIWFFRPPQTREIEYPLTKKEKLRLY